jgi:hypothetical protein
MAAKPTPSHPANTHLLQFNNFGWGTKLLVPSSMLTQLAQLLSLCTIVEEAYLPDGVQLITTTGDVDYGLSCVTGKHIMLDDRQLAKPFEAYYRSTYELIPADDRPPSGVPLVSVEEFRDLLAKGDKA